MAVTFSLLCMGTLKRKWPSASRGRVLNSKVLMKITWCILVLVVWARLARLQQYRGSWVPDEGLRRFLSMQVKVVAQEIKAIFCVWPKTSLAHCKWVSRSLSFFTNKDCVLPCPKIVSYFSWGNISFLSQTNASYNNIAIAGCSHFCYRQVRIIKNFAITEWYHFYCIQVRSTTTLQSITIPNLSNLF